MKRFELKIQEICSDQFVLFGLKMTVDIFKQLEYDKIDRNKFYPIEHTTINYIINIFGDVKILIDEI